MKRKELEALLNKHYENYRHSDSLHGETLEYVIDAMQEALSIGSVGDSTIAETPQKDNDFEPIIKHFKDESGYDTDFDSKPMGGFSDW